MTQRMRPISNVIGIDDGPLGSRRDVRVVGVVYAADRLDGVLSTTVRRDGQNATAKLVSWIRGARAYPQLRAIVMQGITLAGFNVVDIKQLADALSLGVLVVTRKKPNLGRMHTALLEHVPGGAAKWKLIEAAGPMEPCAGLWVQRAGMSPSEARSLITRHRRHGQLPEPVRVAHLIAAGVELGQSAGRA